MHWISQEHGQCINFSAVCFKWRREEFLLQYSFCLNQCTESTIGKIKKKSVIRNISILMCVFYFDKVNITSNSHTVFVFKRYLTTTCCITHICILLTLVYWIVTNLSSSSSGAPPAGNNSSINNISPPRAVTLSQDIPLHSMSMNIYLQVYI